MDSQRLKKRVLDFSSLQEPSTAKHSSNKSSSAISHSLPAPTSKLAVIKTEKEDVAPATEPEPNWLSWHNKIDRILDSFDNDPTAPTVEFPVLFPSNSIPSPRVKPEASKSTPLDAEAERGLPSPSRLLSRLRSPGLDKNHPADVVRRSFAFVAKSLREAFVSKLTSDESLDVDSVIDLANAAFASLSQLEGDSSELYQAVKDLIALRHEVSEAEKELEINGHFKDLVMARRDALAARSSEASKALMSTSSLLKKARKTVSEKQGLINKLKEEVEKGDEETAKLEKEFERVQEEFLAATSEQQDLVKRIEEQKEIVRQINGRREEAKAGIERAKALLSSMLA